MHIEKIVTGYLEENCYIVYGEDKKTIIIDPGSDEAKIEKIIINKELKVNTILVTHYHFDHIGALEYLTKKYKPKIIDFNNADTTVKCAGYIINVIPTYGHTDDSVSFYFEDENVMFTGDFLFKGSIGRYDFDNSDLMEMQNSIKLIKTYPENIKVYPGHGPRTTLKTEFKNNEYLN